MRTKVFSIASVEKSSQNSQGKEKTYQCKQGYEGNIVLKVNLLYLRINLRCNFCPQK